MEGYIGEIRVFAGNFAPRAWAFCEGQLLSIAQNTALFSILGTTYGGDGRTSFALPDLRGRTAINPGTGPGLSTRKLGQRSGLEESSINILQMAAHSHFANHNLTGSTNLSASSDIGNDTLPENNYFAEPDPSNNLYRSGTPDAHLGPSPVTIGGSVTLNNTGNGQPFNNMQPFLGVYFIICMQGIFPSRS